ncbi:IclR family transcriptional regulator domain-containing protein [Streptomyces afghaniensis]|uniref:IclR family transcriptional regulator domain-containing protein n=1 Tax=Streptomyces afghaniensis TaxID=66865 RepID=UPI0027D8EA27|nr:IclR family transcriptional regulator C-terminal domain-containing protein [Streptomyces afghaniensis]
MTTCRVTSQEPVTDDLLTGHQFTGVGTRSAQAVLRPVVRVAERQEPWGAVVEGNGDVHRVDRSHAVRTSHTVGDTSPLHATATGRAVLAHLPKQDIEEFITQGLERYSDTTTVDPAELHASCRSADRRPPAGSVAGPVPGRGGGRARGDPRGPGEGAGRIRGGCDAAGQGVNAVIARAPRRTGTPGTPRCRPGRPHGRDRTA